MTKSIYTKLTQLDTEKNNSNTVSIDSGSSENIVQLISNEDKKCAELVSNFSKEISEAIDAISDKLKNGGRLFYIGAGTSGRLGVLDASECPPTFGSDPEQIQGIIAGGFETLIRSKEGIEDKYEQGWLDLKEKDITSNDIVCGIMASGRTPYVIGAIEQCKNEHIKTIILACNSVENLETTADITIAIPTGPEVIQGSTRMKAGTVQKMVLNMLSTGSMIKLGKVYKNIMVDVQMTSKKLEERAKGMVMDLCDLTYDEASDLLQNAKGHVKSAIAMFHTKKSYSEIQKLFIINKNYLRPIIENGEL